MRQKKIRLAVLVCSLLLLGISVPVYGKRAVGSVFLPGRTLWEPEEGEICVTLPMAYFRRQTIRLWWSEKESKYYLFLPSFWQEGDCLRLWTKAGTPLKLDGNTPAFGRTDALCEGLHSLEIAGECYVLEVMASGEIPALFVEMENGKGKALKEEPYERQYGGTVMLADSEGRVETEGVLDNLRVRGNTSADWVKKPYQMTMRQAADFLHMGSAVKWNLLSNWSDKTLMRNKITYDMAARAGMAYAPESAFVDLYLNGSYEGCYQLCEKVEIGKNRVDIRNLEDYTLYEPDQEERDLDALAEITKEDPQKGGVETLENGICLRGYDTRMAADDLTGGYLLEIERPSRIYASASFFITRGGQPVTVKRPKYADRAQVTYIAGLWQTFEDALFSADGVNPGTGLHYSSYIDEESFVKKYLVEEIVRNYDASSTSQYFYKDTDAADSRIYAGPVWDYDMSLGNPIMSPLTNQHYISSVTPYGLFAALPMDEFSIWYRMYEHEDFREKAAATYTETFLPILRELETEEIDGLASYLEDAALTDGVRWGRNKGWDRQSREREYEESVEILRTFIGTREEYLTGLWRDGRQSVKVYLDGGDADLYISYVEGLIGDVLEEPLAPEKEGYTFIGWLNGYTKEPYDFSKPYDGSDLYFVAQYRKDADGSLLTAGEEQ